MACSSLLAESTQLTVSSTNPFCSHVYTQLNVTSCQHVMLEWGYNVYHQRSYPAALSIYLN